MNKYKSPKPTPESLEDKLVKLLGPAPVAKLLWILLSFFAFITFIAPFSEEIISSVSVSEIGWFGVKANIIHDKIANLRIPSNNVIRTRDINEVVITEKQLDILELRAKKLRKNFQNSSILWVDDRVTENDGPRLVLQSLGVTIYYATNNREAMEALYNSEKECIECRDECFKKRNDECLESYVNQQGISVDSAKRVCGKFAKEFRTRCIVQCEEKCSRKFDVIISDVKHPQVTQGRDGKFIIIDDEVAGIKLAKSDTCANYGAPFIFYVSEENAKLNSIKLDVFAKTNRPDYLLHYVFDALERGGAAYPKGSGVH